MMVQTLTWMMVLVAGLTSLGAADEPKSVTEWLDALEHRGNEIRSLESDVTYNKLNDLTGERQIRGGRVEYAAADSEKKTPARFAIRFDWVVVDTRKDDDKVEYIFDGRWLAEKQHKRKVFIKRQVVKPGESLDPLNLDGPFPLPIGQKRKEVLARFNVQIMTDKPEDNAGDTVHLRFKQKPDAPKIESQKEFERIDLWFDRESLLPTKVVTIDDQGMTTVTLRNSKVNAMSDADMAREFDTSAPAGWRQETGGK
ncbi:MAG: hypothetical protein GC159_08325 [Phycisphaera sp.]|nr:hypothetical protein [Phycisphaera sp.]